MEEGNGRNRHQYLQIRLVLGLLVFLLFQRFQGIQHLQEDRVDLEKSFQTVLGFLFALVDRQDREVRLDLLHRALLIKLLGHQAVLHFQVIHFAQVFLQAQVDPVGSFLRFGQNRQAVPGHHLAL